MASSIHDCNGQRYISAGWIAKLPPGLAAESLYYCHKPAVSTACFIASSRTLLPSLPKMLAKDLKYLNTCRVDLPPDVLLSIFQRYCQSFSYPEKMLESLAKLRMVSKSWRDVVQQFPVGSVTCQQPSLVGSMYHLFPRMTGMQVLLQPQPGQQESCGLDLADLAHSTILSRFELSAAQEQAVMLAALKDLPSSVTGLYFCNIKWLPRIEFQLTSVTKLVSCQRGKPEASWLELLRCLPNLQVQ